jgi:aminopeptidase
VADARIEAYTKLLVEDCVDVQPGWQVLVVGSHLARPLIEEIVRQVARRGAYALQRVTFGEASWASRVWLREAPLELVSIPAPIERHAAETMDALIVVDAPENTRELSAVTQERYAALQAAYRPSMERVFRSEIPWVGCQYPTPALAQDAGMSTDEFADFLYGACLLDWDAERERMQRYAERFDAAEQVRIVGDETDLTLSLAGRSMEVDAGGANIPGGEFFGCPVENSAEGVVTFAEFPAVYAGRELTGIRLRFEGGCVVEASAVTSEAFLLETLDQDEGARRLNTLFDEKIDGTVHLALGNGMPDLGGENVSMIHWDIVKDLRTTGSRIELDGEVVQRDGAWLV